MTYIEREIEKDIKKWLHEREILVIRGPRQCGKTTILKRIEQNLKESEKQERQTVYLSFEDDIIRLKFEEDPLEFIGSYILNKSKHYFLLDEVQYIKNIGKKLKLVFDSFNNIKIIVTGSSSFDLTNLGKYLVGRVIFMDLGPFSFQELLKTKDKRYELIYLENQFSLKKPAIKKSLFLNELNKFLREYLTFGGYPRIVLEPSKEKKRELLKNMFATYIEKDIVSLYGNKYRDNIIKIIKVISLISGIIKYESLSQDAAISTKEIKKILPLLEDSFIIKIVKPFHRNLINEIRKNPKIYFVDYGIRNYISGKLDSPELEILYENFICNQLATKHKINYWRTTAKTEVDFIIDEEIPIEVKTTPKISRSLRSFISFYKPKYAILANLRESKKVKVGKRYVFITPLAYFNQ